MPRREDVEITGESDLTPEWMTSEEKILGEINRRYIACGRPEEWLTGYLDARQSGVWLEWDGTVFERTCRLSFEWLLLLAEDLELLRERMNPPGEDGEFE